ncbi:unnamed protein product [Acanthoscelides obtectus]|uniref:Carboxylic ester hydrolase n=1 Tax=Acanthoscelides obtectus TaxID=200917 RepID=A0A9P0L284_ACAOB|nr:unnamed protein product [Acanthoscelides obtectus]CAK1659410.1 hypothetical protein AOBTE_LOCUS21442 [Acanthoscelides obtectus]
MTPGKKLPVLLWFHGGGFKSGSNFFVVGLVAGRYDPAYLMDEEIVVVSPNYRIGPLGFLTTKDNVIPTNLGLRDQRLAINWVKDNIDKFGGDPSDIVIAGESAGAVSVGYHLIATYKELPITGAILISGSALCPWASHTKSRKNAFELARKLDHTFKSNRSEDLLKLLQSATPEQILARTGFRQSQGAQSFNGALTLAWVPTLGKGDDFSLPQTDAVDNGKFKKVPMLIGFNDEEGVNPYISGNYLQKSTAWEKDPSNMLFENIRVPRTKRKEFGQKLKSFYTNTSFVTDARSVIKICSDFALAMPTIRFAESASKHAQVYMFLTSQTFQPHPLAAGKYACPILLSRPHR